MVMATPPAPGNSVEAELAAVARDCRALAHRLALLTSATSNPRRSPVEFASAQVRRYLRARRLREELLPAELFADPAWDMLLDLYASEVEGRRVSISSACIAAAVPPTTALRWLTRLEEVGLTRRQGDAKDSRRSFVRLTPAAQAGIERWLEQAPWIAGL